jgi:hypothetical protein
LFFAQVQSLQLSRNSLSFSKNSILLNIARVDFCCCEQQKIIAEIQITASDSITKNKIKNSMPEPGVVEHTCNPSYLGGRGRKVTNLRPAQAKLARPYLKN